MSVETNRPSRYMLPAGLEVIDVIQHVLPNIVGQDATKYGVAQAIRYMLRLGRKDSAADRDWETCSARACSSPHS